MRDRVLLAAVVLVLVAAAPVFAEERQWLSLSSSVNYLVGDYGTDKDTTIVTMPLASAADSVLLLM